MWALLGVLFVWGSMSILFLGGREYFGPPTASGFRPRYTHSAWRYYVTTMAVLIPLIHKHSMVVYYQNFMTLQGVFIVASFAIGALVYLKGRMQSECMFG